MHAIQKLSEYFQKFPGIGARQAKRFVFFLLQQDKQFLDELVKYIQNIKNAIQECTRCHRFFDADGHADVCDICSSPNRDKQLLMIVEKDTDLDAIERSNAYNGTYFVLGGTLPLLESKKLSTVRFNELTHLVKKEKTTLQEIILATSFTPEGEHTAYYINDLLRSLLAQNMIRLSALGRGLSTGTELEYSDKDTIQSALHNRK